MVQPGRVGLKWTAAYQQPVTLALTGICQARYPPPRATGTDQLLRPLISIAASGGQPVTPYPLVDGMIQALGMFRSARSCSRDHPDEFLFFIYMEIRIGG
jgi:hypothetical protein